MGQKQSFLFGEKPSKQKPTSEGQLKTTINN